MFHNSLASARGAPVKTALIEMSKDSWSFLILNKECAQDVAFIFKSHFKAATN